MLMASLVKVRAIPNIWAVGIGRVNPVGRDDIMHVTPRCPISRLFRSSQPFRKAPLVVSVRLSNKRLAS